MVRRKASAWSTQNAKGRDHGWKLESAFSPGRGAANPDTILKLISASLDMFVTCGMLLKKMGTHQWKQIWEVCRSVFCSCTSTSLCLPACCCCVPPASPSRLILRIPQHISSAWIWLFCSPVSYGWVCVFLGSRSLHFWHEFLPIHVKRNDVLIRDVHHPCCWCFG